MASLGVVGAGKARQPFMLANIGRWSRKEWGAVLAVAALLLLLKMMGAPSTVEMQQLRNQFRLPDDVALTTVHVGRSSGKSQAAAIEGLVQFTDQQFVRYVASLDDQSVWQPSPVTHGGTEFHGPYAPGTLAWNDVRGVRQLAWGSLSWKQAQDVRNGRHLCFSVREIDGDQAATRFRGEPCPPPSTPSVRAVYVQGLLDFDTKSLHMLIRQTQRARAYSD